MRNPMQSTDPRALLMPQQQQAGRLISRDPRLKSTDEPPNLPVLQHPQFVPPPQLTFNMPMAPHAAYIMPAPSGQPAPNIPQQPGVIMPALSLNLPAYLTPTTTAVATTSAHVTEPSAFYNTPVPIPSSAPYNDNIQRHTQPATGWMPHVAPPQPPLPPPMIPHPSWLTAGSTSNSSGGNTANGMRCAIPPPINLDDGANTDVR